MSATTHREGTCRPRIVTDGTLSLLLKGYAWLPDRRRRDGDVVHTRLLGHPVVGLCGPDAARFFYDEAHVRRHTAVPGLVQRTLFGQSGVQTLDGAEHRHRKAAFLTLTTEEQIANLVGHTLAAWTQAVGTWPDRSRVVLFDEASRILTAGVCRWAGIPLAGTQTAELARDLVALVDGFATIGPRHWRAREARARRERWLERLVLEVRDNAVRVPADCVVAVFARHRDTKGALLPPRVAAVEILNVVRPTVAVCWYLAFAGHALYRWPEHRHRLQTGEQAFADAFSHEVRRFYPFAPFVAGRAVRDLFWRGEPIPADALVFLDLYGQNHDPTLWLAPYTFDPQRFIDRPVDAFDLVPQGAGDVHTGHRCPGEAITMALMSALIVELARLDYRLPPQDFTIPLRRLPTRPRSGVILAAVRPAEPARPPEADRPAEAHRPVG